MSQIPTDKGQRFFLRKGFIALLLALIVAAVLMSAYLMLNHVRMRKLSVLEEKQISLWLDIQRAQILAARHVEMPDPNFGLEEVLQNTLALLAQENVIRHRVMASRQVLESALSAAGMRGEDVLFLLVHDIDAGARRATQHLLNQTDADRKAFSDWYKATFNDLQSQSFLDPLKQGMLLTRQYSERLLAMSIGLLLVSGLVLIAMFWLTWLRKMRVAFQQLNAANENLRAQNFALQRADSQSQVAQQMAKFGYWVMGADGHIACSDGLLHILESRDTAPIQSLDDLVNLSSNAERKKLSQFYSQTLARGTPDEIVRTLKRSTGHLLYLRERIEFPLDQSGHALGVFGIVLDITERKEVENRLIHAQKMEAVGQLTGGIAHDFNNLLAVVTGNAELIRMSDTAATVRYADTILATVKRGMRLVDQLLLFSSRSSLSPEVLYLSDVLAGMSELVPRSLTKQVQLHYYVQPDLWPLYVDRAMLENSLLNLILNATAALGEYGDITLHARNVPDASIQKKDPDTLTVDHLLLEIHDNGLGMTDDVRQRAFEPFFTTRGKGEGGSGLGLSMVYVFVKSSQGAISIDSLSGQGTTVRICLPRSKESIRVAEKRPICVPRGSGERVLVVEDQVELLDIVAAQLESLGYKTCRAENAPDAERILQSDTTVDLLLTDIKLPLGISGIQLAETAIRLRPDLKIIFTSGYADIDYAESSQAIRETEVLRKPIGYQAMAEGVQRVLAS